MQGRSLKEILDGPELSAEEKLECSIMVPVIIRLQSYPDLALIALSGIVVPPHERLMLGIASQSAQTNINVSSRGTSKTSVIAVLHAGHTAITSSKRKIVELSASGFRGGQLIFNDFEKWVTGGWSDQEGSLEYLSQSATNPKVVHRGQNWWSIKFDSESEIQTFPTNNIEKLRGIRGHILILDEANTMEPELVEEVALPFLNVTGGFRSGGLDAPKNQVFYTSTIDYSWREFHQTAESAYAAVDRDYQAMKASLRGDWDTYTALAKDGLFKQTYTSFDYTDTIIRREISTRTGKRYRVNYPQHAYNKRLRFTQWPQGIPFTTRDEQGNILQDSPPVEALKTYPVDTEQLESKLRDGTGSVSVWLAEQRNVTDTAVGDVYSSILIDRAEAKGDRCVIPYSKLPESWQKRHTEDERDYSPSVMWSCTDPCVVGVDYASGDRDFSALVVIRLGPLARGDFNPFTGLGNTSWSNVIWCEMHRLTSHKDVADKIREYRDRYNLVWFDTPGETDMWKQCRAIGLDMRGGGNGVRDELVRINDQELKAEEYRIYDPLDKDPRIEAFAKPPALPMLDTIYPSDQLNDKLVEYTVGQMQQGLLYLPKTNTEIQVNMDKRVRIGHNGAEVLSHQLRKLQQAPTKNWRTFFMKGDTEKVANKKDMWAAFIYAAKQARAHIMRQNAIDNTPPPLAALRTTIGGGRRHNGKASGSKF